MGLRKDVAQALLASSVFSDASNPPFSALGGLRPIVGSPCGGNALRVSSDFGRRFELSACYGWTRKDPFRFGWNLRGPLQGFSRPISASINKTRPGEGFLTSCDQ